MMPFYLLYGREARLPSDDPELEEERPLRDHMMAQFEDLTKNREQAKLYIQADQHKQKDRHDKKLPKLVRFNIGDQVLYYRATLDNQHSGKLEPKWKGPYIVYQIIGNGAYKIRSQDGRELPNAVNGTFLKLYKERTALALLATAT